MVKSIEVAISPSNKLGNVKESKKTRSHDVALMCFTENTQLIVNLFYPTVYDIYSWQTLANNQWGEHVNQGDIFPRVLKFPISKNCSTANCFST